MASLGTTSAPNSNSVAANNSSTNATPIDADQLARDMIDEVEKTINTSNHVKLGSVDSCLSILKQIITAADLHRSDNKDKNSPEHVKTNQQNNEQQQVGDSIYADYADDNEQFNAIDLTEQFATNSVKWTIRVRAFKLVHRIVQLLRKFESANSSRPSVIRHLPDLIRLSFVAATSPFDDLKLQGFEMFKVLIDMFAMLEEKEFPGHSILEQYKTQVLSAIKPAFDVDAPPYITAIATQVCCSWLCYGLEKNKLDLKRTFQLMKATIGKLENQSSNQNSKLYTETELEQERLDILGAWAQLYIMAKRKDSDINLSSTNQSKVKKIPNWEICSVLDQLVEPHISSLVNKWWEALKDYALLIMPATKTISLSHDNEQVYTRNVALRLFQTVWPKLILASTIWLCLDRIVSESNNSHLSSVKQSSEVTQLKSYKPNKVKYFKFICGIITKELCEFISEHQQNNSNIHEGDLPETTVSAIKSLEILINNSDFKLLLMEQLSIAQEYYVILYSILMINRKSRCQYNQTIKILLDRLFELALSMMKSKPENITYGAVILMKLIEDRASQFKKLTGSDTYEELKLVLYLKFYNLLTIIKHEPKVTMEQEHIRGDLIKTFQSILSFDFDLSLSLTYLSPLKEVHKFVSVEHSNMVLRNLFATKIEVVSKVLELLLKDTSNRDKNILYVETYSKYIEDDIESADADMRSILIKEYVVLMINKLQSCQERMKTSGTDLKESTIFDLILKRIKAISNAHRDLFEASITSEIQANYQSAIKLQEKNKNDSKGQKEKVAQASKKQLETANKSIGKPSAKIVLKADFSNFYSKKS